MFDDVNVVIRHPTMGIVIVFILFYTVKIRYQI